MTLATAFVRSADTHAPRVALRTADGATMTYGRLDELTARVAGLLTAAGIQAGDRVGIMLPNVPEFAVVYYGVLRAGGVVVPMNPLLKAREVALLPGRLRRQAGVRLAPSADEAAGGRGRAEPHRHVVDATDSADLIAGAQPAARGRRSRATTTPR